MGGFCPGGFVQGDFVWGDFVLGGILSRGILSGGFCPRTPRHMANALFIGILSLKKDFVAFLLKHCC